MKHFIELIASCQLAAFCPRPSGVPARRRAHHGHQGQRHTGYRQTGARRPRGPDCVCRGDCRNIGAARGRERRMSRAARCGMGCATTGELASRRGRAPLDSPALMAGTRGGGHAKRVRHPSLSTSPHSEQFGGGQVNAAWTRPEPSLAQCVDPPGNRRNRRLQATCLSPVTVIRQGDRGRSWLATGVERAMSAESPNQVPHCGRAACGC